MPVKDGAAMIAGMQPDLQPGTFVFVTTSKPDLALMDAALASFREAEGISYVVTEDAARVAGHGVDAPMRQITLNVYSDLEGVGLTAAVSTALADVAIPANVIAAYHHDHVFVPADKAEAAMCALLNLQNGGT